MSQTPPLTAFHFSVSLHGWSALVDDGFSAISGLVATRRVQDVYEGGLNDRVHRLPLGAAPETLRLTRWVVPDNSPLRDWAVASLNSGLNERIKPLDLDIRLLDAQGDPCDQWFVGGAWPLKMCLDPLEADGGKLAVESYELACSRITRETLVSKVVDAIGGQPWR